MAATPSDGADARMHRQVKKPKLPARKTKPVQDEWGFFDPERCGFSTLLAKLEEITESPNLRTRRTRGRMHTPNMRRASRGRQCASAFAVGSGLVCLYAMRQADPDLWGYLTYGRLFVETRGLTAHDPSRTLRRVFSGRRSSMALRVLLWLAYHLAGPLGLIGLKCAVGGATLCCVLIAVRATTSEPFVWGPVFFPSLHVGHMPLLSFPSPAVHVRVLRTVRGGVVGVPLRDRRRSGRYRS